MIELAQGTSPLISTESANRHQCVSQCSNMHWFVEYFVTGFKAKLQKYVESVFTKELMIKKFFYANKIIVKFF